MHGRNSAPARPAPHAGPPQVYRARHDPDGSANLSTTVAHAVADCMGVDVTETTFSINDCVDPEALDKLFRPRYDGTPRVGGTLTFFVEDYRVTVHADGEILIEPPSGGR